MLFIEIPFATPLYHQALNIRNEELRVPLGLHFNEDEILQEYREICLGALGQDLELIATLNFKIIDNSMVKMRQVAVLKNEQGKGIGFKLMQYAEHWANRKGYSSISLHARSSVVSFYERLGYHVSGNEFEEVGLPHRYMSKSLIAT